MRITEMARIPALSDSLFHDTDFTGFKFQDDSFTGVYQILVQLLDVATKLKHKSLIFQVNVHIKSAH